MSQETHTGIHTPPAGMQMIIPISCRISSTHTHTRCPVRATLFSRGFTNSPLLSAHRYTYQRRWKQNNPNMIPPPPHHPHPHRHHHQAFIYQIRQFRGRALRFKSSCICDVHFKSKQIQSISKPPTEYRVLFYLNPLKKRGGGGKKRRKHADEISIGGLFHKQLNFPFCVSHLILSNMPKAIHPRAHCLNIAQFMSPPHPPPQQQPHPPAPERAEPLAARLRSSTKPRKGK